MDDILNRFEDVTMRLFKKYDMEVVGFWTVSKPEDKCALVYLMRYSDEVAMEKAWAAFRADSEWIETRERTEANGPIVEEVISDISYQQLSHPCSKIFYSGKSNYYRLNFV